MSRPLNVLPDIELALTRYLSSRAEVRALVAPAQILSSLPSTPVLPSVLIQRGGGVPIVAQRLDEAAIQIDVLGGTHALCSMIMRTVGAAITAIANDVTADAVLVSADTEVGPAWLPDMVPTPPLSRFLARYRVRATPRP